MKFDLNKSYEILERTPAVLKMQLQGVHDDWALNNEGQDTFSPYDVVGHLIHGEKTDWPDRIKLILKSDVAQPFVPYDRFAMFDESKGKTLTQLLDEFETIRQENMTWLHSLHLSENDFDKKGIHPKFGEVTLRHLLSTWVVHDLTHMAQITRVMAKQYKEEIGPWVEFFRIMNF